MEDRVQKTLSTHAHCNKRILTSTVTLLSLSVKILLTTVVVDTVTNNPSLRHSPRIGVPLPRVPLRVGVLRLLSPLGSVGEEKERRLRLCR